eukprot:349681-Chlamydomonas_euryale.AAC.4
MDIGQRIYNYLAKLLAMILTSGQIVRHAVPLPDTGRLFKENDVCQRASGPTDMAFEGLMEVHKPSQACKRHHPPGGQTMATGCRTCERPGGRVRCVVGRIERLSHIWGILTGDAELDLIAKVFQDDAGHGVPKLDVHHRPIRGVCRSVREAHAVAVPALELDAAWAVRSHLPYLAHGVDFSHGDTRERLVG